MVCNHTFERQKGSVLLQVNAISEAATSFQGIRDQQVLAFLGTIVKKYFFKGRLRKTIFFKGNCEKLCLSLFSPYWKLIVKEIFISFLRLGTPLGNFHLNKTRQFSSPFKTRQFSGKFSSPLTRKSSEKLSLGNPRWSSLPIS